jgi:Flp pilus assembly pilin Flp
MVGFLKSWTDLRRDEEAVTALEYALIAGVIVATVLVGFQALAGNLSSYLAGITF